MAGLGHFGFGFAAKRLVPRVHLAVLLAASEAIDLIYVVFLLAGIDSAKAGTLTHSLIMSAIWTVSVGLAVFIFSRSARSALVVGLVVFSHWILDFIVWPMTAIFPDAGGIPLFFGGSPLVGLGLYRWLAMTIVGEAFLVIGGVVIYVLALKKIRKERNTVWK